MHKPRVHLEIRPIEQQHDAGLMAYVNFTYADAFQGAFTVRGGSMRFLVADKTHQTLASVSVLNLRSVPPTHSVCRHTHSDNMRSNASSWILSDDTP
eukprot:44688-Eustigmatos_ZCMA.PRE.1